MIQDLNASLNLFQALLGPDRVLHGERLALRNPGYCQEAFAGGILLLPGNQEDVSNICKIATTHSIPLVAHGGLTGLVDGTQTGLGEVAISFERMNRISRLDPVQGIAIVDAGVCLEDLIEASAPHGMQPGVDLPSRGQCTLAGMAATNAGGIQAIRYGTMRDNILGLTVVLPNGDILDLKNVLVKNNAGYDLKHIFIGSEGTLGFITELVIKLHPKPKSKQTALVGCADSGALFALLNRAKAHLGAHLLSFEAMWPSYFEITADQPGMSSRPLSEAHAVYGLIEIGAWNAQETAGSEMEAFLEAAFEADLVADATIAQSESQRTSLWRIREDSDVIESAHDICLTYDIGLETADIPNYINALDQTIKNHQPELSTYYFGHMGDGNLHVMIGGSLLDLANRTEIDAFVYGALKAFQYTTISAEHGIGLEKRLYLSHSRSSEAITMMEQLKLALDPNGILNPGKVLSSNTKGLRN